MSTPYPIRRDRATTRRDFRLPGWAREPLLHFVLLGAVLFAIDHVVVGRADDPRRIVVGPEVDAEARQTFFAAARREPTAAELAALRRAWLDNEVLYREGLAMQVDKGDPAIRERVIFKALSVVDANVRLPVPDESTLRTYFEKHRARYDEPARYDFHEAMLAGTADESAIRAFVTDLNAGTTGDAEAGLRIFRGRPEASLAQAYGAGFPGELAAATPGEWRALRTRDGWRAIRVDAIAPSRPADFATLRGVVHQDWKDAAAAEQRTAAVRALAGKYRVEYAGGGAP
jgi:hypothetical protein